MNKKILALSIILILTTMYVTSISVSNVNAQTSTGGKWITSYTLKDASTGVTISNGQISEGQELEVTANINIAVSNPSTSLTLTTSMQHSALQANMYWELAAGSSNYSLGNFDPNSKTITFPENAGTLDISCFGLVPSGGVSQTTSNGVQLDVPTPLDLMVLQDPSGAILDQVKLNITDANIVNYLNLLSQKQASLKNLQNSGVDSGYIAIYSSVITASQALEAQGFATAAISMLNGLNVSAPPSAGSQALFLPVAGVLAVVAVLFAFMFFRTRGKVSYYQLVVEDQIKDLEGLTMRISRIDRNASSTLESVKDRLKRLVGM